MKSVLKNGTIACMANPSEILKTLVAKLRGLLPGSPPEDPYAYVTAPKRPRLPHLSAAAVAERPEE
jgi:hypothetical protein